MSNRAQRREAERLALKQLRRQPPQPAVEIPSLNATRHGCCALEILVLPTENRADFEAITAAWQQTFILPDEASRLLVDQLIAADWLNRRSIRTYAEVEAKVFAAEPNPMNWTDEHHKLLTRFQRYRTANQNAFNKARRAVEDHLKNRSNEIDQAERMSIRRSRLKVYEVKNAPEPTWDEIIANMRQKAINMGYYKPSPDEK